MPTPIAPAAEDDDGDYTPEELDVGDGADGQMAMAAAAPATTMTMATIATTSLGASLEVPQRRKGKTVSGKHGKPPRKGPWTKEEDQILAALVERYGPKDWSFIASHIVGRIGKQCRERYHNHLAPDVKKDAWTPEEDEAIIHAHHIYGNKWTDIAKLLGNGRPPNAIKNRWNSSLRRRVGDLSAVPALNVGIAAPADQQQQQ
jgi:hypothetical protein